MMTETTVGRLLRFTCGADAVDLHADERTADDVVGLTAPFFAARDLTETSAVPIVSTGTGGGLGAGWRRVTYSSAFEPDRELWVSDEHRGIRLCGEPSPWLSTQALRSVRNLMRWQAHGRGDLLVHGGMVATDEIGVAILGHKRSGKTSSIVSALLAGAAFVSNDDLVIGADHADVLVGIGYPRTVNIRTETVLALARREPRLVELFHSASHPTNSYPGDHNSSDDLPLLPKGGHADSVWVRCAELAEATDAALLPAHRIDAVVFPRFLPTGEPPRIEELTRVQARTELAEHVDSVAVRFDPFLNDWFTDRDTHRADALADRLFATVPFLRLHQSIDRLADGSATLLAAVGKGGQR